jgi:hypothetical protein
VPTSNGCTWPSTDVKHTLPVEKIPEDSALGSAGSHAGSQVVKRGSTWSGPDSCEVEGAEACEVYREGTVLLLISGVMRVWHVNTVLLSLPNTRCHRASLLATLTRTMHTLALIMALTSCTSTFRSSSRCYVLSVATH